MGDFVKPRSGRAPPGGIGSGCCHRPRDQRHFVCGSHDDHQFQRTHIESAWKNCAHPGQLLDHQHREASARPAQWLGHLPEISRFFGIVVAMFYAEHGVPHFHAVYGEQKVSIGIQDHVVLEGTLQPRALRPVLEWSRLHEAELLANWHRARRGEPLERIAPLE